MRRKKLKGKYTDIKVSSLSKFINKNKLKLITISSFLVVLTAILLINSPKDNVFKSSYKKLLANNGIYTEEIKSIDITTDDYDEPGSFKVTKKAEWTDYGKAKLTITADSIIKPENNNKKDIILVMDVSGSMYGEKLNKAKEDAIDLTNNILSDNKNKIGLITFDTNAEIIFSLTNDINTINENINSLTIKGDTNYNDALKKVDNMLENYQEQNNRDLIVLFLTDGNPCEDTPNEVSTYKILKEKYPSLTIQGIQYEMGSNITEALKNISDHQFNASVDTLGNVLIDASTNPVSYEEFIITDYIDTDYFEMPDESNIKASIGSYELDGNKITWNLGESYVTGNKASLTVNLTQKERYLDEEGFYPTNEKESIKYKLGEENETISSHDTPVLKNIYEVIYNTSAPEGCTLTAPESEKYPVGKSAIIKDDELSCNGYEFKGWSIKDDDDINYISSESFKMPTRDVYIIASWSKQSIAKKMDGKVHTEPILYNVLKNEANSGSGLAKEYTGEHADAYDRSGTQKIYQWYAYNDTNGTAILDKNNVIFANHCWQMIRTTDTGGVKMIYNGEPENNQCLNTRGTHVGYTTRTSGNIAYNYWYGTDYTYDSVSKTFKLSGTLEQAKWSDTTWPNLIGKYTCLMPREEDDCVTLSLVESYNSAKNANIIQLKSNSNYSQFGTLPYNKNNNSLAYVGYMYGDIYNANQQYFVKDISFKSTQTMLNSAYLYTSHWYADMIDYGNLTANKYSLVDPYKISGSSDYPNLIGKYTLRSSNQSYASTNAYYIAGVDSSNMYYTKLSIGEMLSEYEPILFGESINDNGDGTYTINNPVAVSLVDWYTNYSNYKNKYTCNSNNATCSAPRYVISTTNTNYNYVNAAEKILLGKSRNGVILTDTILVGRDEWYNNYNNYSEYKYTCHTSSVECTESTLRMITKFDATAYRYVSNKYFGSGVTWDGTNYTLKDPIEIENYNDYNNLSTHHYMCLEPGLKTCQIIAYIYYYSDTNWVYYIQLKNGVTTVSQALSDMIAKNTTNSVIKTGVDEWYRHYMLDYDDYIEDTVFCNNRSIQSINGWKDDGGNINEALRFNDYTQKNDLSCANEEDRFSVLNPIAKSKYKVGLMSRPDMFVFYKVRKTGQRYWLSSPYYQDYSTCVHTVNSDGNIGDCMSISSNFGVRPAISLRPGIEYTDGDGSKEHPYIIDTEED